MNKKRARIKRKLFFANQYEINAIEEFLEQEAANGWMLIKYSGVYYVFQECEPIKLKFQVDYFVKAKPEAETLEYIEYCREAGWKHVFGKGKLQIFYSDIENTFPIQTDEKMKLKLAVKATMHEQGVLWIFLPIIYGLTLGTQITSGMYSAVDYSSYANLITEYIELLSFCFLYIIFVIIEITRFGKFYFSNKRRLKKGLTIEFYAYKNVKRYHHCFQCMLLLLVVYIMQIFFDSPLPPIYWLVIVISVVLMALLIGKITYSKRANRTTNIVTTIVATIVVTIVIMGSTFFFIISNLTDHDSKDTIPVTLDDLGLVKPHNYLYEETSIDKSESFLGKSQQIRDYCITEGFYKGYTIDIFSSKFSGIIQRYNDLILEDKNLSIKKMEDTKSDWFSDQVFIGDRYGTVAYVILGEGITYVITGDLSELQAAELYGYYRKKN